MDELQNTIDTKVNTLCNFTYIKFPKKGKFIEKKSRKVVAWGWWYMLLGFTINKHEKSY